MTHPVSEWSAVKLPGRTCPVKLEIPERKEPLKSRLRAKEKSCFIVAFQDCKQRNVKPCVTRCVCGIVLIRRVERTCFYDCYRGRGIVCFVMSECVVFFLLREGAEID